MNNSIKTLDYRNSRDNMGKLMTRLKMQYKRLPEGDEGKLKLQRKIETLRIIRAEMKILINALD